MAQATKSDALADRLVQAADRLLEEQGLAALSTRAVAEAADTTTMTIYSRFGGKAGLLEAIYRQGFADLAARQEEVLSSGADTVERLLGLCLAFRRVAVEHRSRYDLMMGHTGGVRPGGDSLAVARSTFERIASVVATAMREEVFAPADPALVAHQIVAQCHGLIALERSDLSPVDDAESAYVSGVDTLLRGLICKPRPG